MEGIEGGRGQENEGKEEEEKREMRTTYQNTNIYISSSSSSSSLLLRFRFHNPICLTSAPPPPPSPPFGSNSLLHHHQFSFSSLLSFLPCFPSNFFFSICPPLLPVFPPLHLHFFSIFSRFFALRKTPGKERDEEKEEEID